MKVATRLAACVLVASVTAHAAGAPLGASKHPRMLLDPALREAWRALAHVAGSPVARAIDVCSDAGTTDKYDHAQYQGSEWAKALQACLVAWAATGDARHAATSIAYFTALLDDLDVRGDRRGGDQAARRDSGYAIRNLGPYTALAYDWLFDQISPALRAHARQRWAAWLDWYAERGYRARAPGNNYHAGYLISATMIAIAQAEDDPRRWSRVADDLWGHDMAAALAAGGILEGGDWAEGWQYGPLSVAEYALAARLAARAGVQIRGVEPWLAGVLRRHVYALSPADRQFAGGDTEDSTANLAPAGLPLDAVAFGDARPDDRRWARGEIVRLHLDDDDGWLLYRALGAIAGEPADVPRMLWPTWYLAAATGTLYARTRWDDRAVWFVATCQRGLDVDHRHPDAGNFVLSRGKDDVIVDPSPYGSQSTLTSNAPTVASSRLPAKYTPSQGAWSTRTGWDFTTQTRSGVIAARCDYADQFRFQERPSDIADALRDLVVVPSSDGTDAAVVVVDRARTGAGNRAMYLRFRVPGELTLDGDVATRTIGATRLAITSAARSSGRPALGHAAHTDCYADEAHKGRCDAARFPVSDLRLDVDGPEPSAVHVISATAAEGPAAPRPTPLTGDGWAGVRIAGPRDAVVVWPAGKPAALTYRAPRALAMTHVVLVGREHLALTARPDGDACVVSVAPGSAGAAPPLVAVLDDACRVELDPATVSAAAALGALPPAPPRAPPARHRRWGCSAGEPAGAPVALAVVAWALRRRRSSRAAR